MKNRLQWLLLASMLLGFASQAKAICVGSIVVSGTTVQFGTYNPVSGTARTAQGTITVGCAGIGLLGAYTTSLSVGAGTFAQRHLTSGANTLNYNLFTDSAYSQVWGNGTGGSITLGYSGLLSLSTVSSPVYARMPAGQDKPPGTYSATIIATVEF